MKKLVLILSLVLALLFPTAALASPKAGAACKKIGSTQTYSGKKFTCIKSGKKILHFNGAYHTDFNQGIIWYIQQAVPSLDTVSISTVTQKSINQLEKEHMNKAPFIICIAEDMTRTY